MSPLPLINADGELSITLGNTFLSLFARILEIILYTHPTKEIGL